MANLIELIEKSAKARGESFVPRDYIVEALEKIENGEIDVERYPTGVPSLKGVYAAAQKIYEECIAKK